MHNKGNLTQRGAHVIYADAVVYNESGKVSPESTYTFAPQTKFGLHHIHTSLHNNGPYQANSPQVHRW